jgi:hypothetical protein
MKETEAAIANRGRSALRPIDLDVLAARDVGAIHGYPPLPPRSLESSGWRVKAGKIFEEKEVAGKILSK